MYCKKCGSKIDVDSIYCSVYGIKLKHESNPIINYSKKQSNSKLNSEKDSSLKYDLTYKNDYSLVIVGIVLLLLISLFGLTTELQSETLIILAIVSFFIRVGIIIWIVKTAEKLYLNRTFWAIFAFFFPAIAVIVIAFFKKKIYTKNYFTLSDEDKSYYNNNLACRYFNAKRYNDGLKLVNAAIEYKKNNHAAYDTRGMIKYYQKDYKSALKDLNKSIELDSNHAIKYYHRGYILKKLGLIDNAMEDWNTAVEMGLDRAKTAIENNIE